MKSNSTPQKAANNYAKMERAGIAVEKGNAKRLASRFTADRGKRGRKGENGAQVAHGRDPT